MTAVRKPDFQTYDIELDEEIANRLRQIAERTGDTVENLIVSAALAYADRGVPPLNVWSREDLAAINEGFAQIDRGEAFTQEEVEDQIDATLR